tara:strand:+ start:12785 stop:13150 length:366 start_codon:yes stop_codon:yes gene_type:complete
MTTAPTRKVRNRISTSGYFIKRLRDAKYVVWRLVNVYADHDPRRWTVLIDPGVSSVIVTCYENKSFNGEIMFEINDGGSKFPKNSSIKTDSIEVVVNTLVEAGIGTAEKNPYAGKKPTPRE